MPGLRIGWRGVKDVTMLVERSRNNWTAVVTGLPTPLLPQAESAERNVIEARRASASRPNPDARYPQPPAHAITPGEAEERAHDREAAVVRPREAVAVERALQPAEGAVERGGDASPGHSHALICKLVGAVRLSDAGKGKRRRLLRMKHQKIDRNPVPPVGERINAARHRLQLDS